MLNKLFEVMEIRSVKVFFHWSVLLIGAVILLGALEEPLLAFAVLAAYFGVILIHECGHMVAAQRKGCAVLSIEVYPIWGITRFSQPYSRFDLCVIAWGGVLAQAIVGVPLVAWVEIFGYTRFQAVNAILAILGFLSLGNCLGLASCTLQAFTHTACQTRTRLEIVAVRPFVNCGPTHISVG
jgi:hypothetical protein